MEGEAPSEDVLAVSATAADKAFIRTIPSIVTGSWSCVRTATDSDRHPVTVTRIQCNA